MKKLQQKAFVLMPFNKEILWVYKEIIADAVRSEGLFIDRMDEENHADFINKRIIEKILQADLIFVVLTDFRPNVMYELGICHSLLKPTILLLEDKQEVPFNINQFNVYYYPKYTSRTKENRIKNLKENIVEICNRQKQGDFKFGSPINFVNENPFSHIFQVSPLDVVRSRTAKFENHQVRIKNNISSIRKIAGNIPKIQREDNWFKRKVKEVRLLFTSFASLFLLRSLRDHIESAKNEVITVKGYFPEYIEGVKSLIFYRQELAEVEESLTSSVAYMKSIISDFKATSIDLDAFQKEVNLAVNIESIVPLLEVFLLSIPLGLRKLLKDKLIPSPEDYESFNFSNHASSFEREVKEISDLVLQMNTLLIEVNEIFRKTDFN